MRDIRKKKKKKKKKKRKKKRERRSYTSHKSQNHYTTARAQDRCCCFFIDNVAFAKEKTNKTYEAIKNWSLAAPKMASLATDTEKQTNNYDQDQKSSFCKAKKQKQQTNRKRNSKYFLQHQHTRGLQRRHTSTTTKTWVACGNSPDMRVNTWVACGNSPDMRVNTRYINSTRGISSKRSTARFGLSVVDG